MVLLDRMAKHDSRKAIEASLRANSPSQPTSFHLSLPIAIITGDYRQISYPVITTLVSLLGYNSAILYPSYFPLQLSGPSISNPPTSNSFNHLINPLGPLLPTGRGNQNKVLINRVVKLYKITHGRPQQSLLISIHAYLISVYINHNYHNYVRSALTQAFLIAADIKSTCRPQQPFLGRSKEGSNTMYGSPV